jgi:hypothetical protein
LTAGQEAPVKPRTFRSPVAVAVWWLWVLFAAGNLIDLAVQGRDHLSLVAAFILLLVTGVVYTAAERPRIVAGPEELRIINPLRDHRVAWAAVAGFDATDLVRVRCEWPAGKRMICSWAVHSSRRRQIAAEVRAERQSRRRGAGAGRGFGVFGTPPDGANPPPAPTAADVEHVISELTALAGQAKEVTPEQRAVPPVSTWYWPAFAAIVVPALALLIVVLALRRESAALTARACRRVAGPGPQPSDVVGRRAGLDRRVHQDGQVPRGGQPALVCVEHVQPGERVPVLLGLHPDLELAVEAEGHPVPAVKFLLVDLRHVVEHDEHSLGGVLDDRGERTIPADVLTAEGQAPAFEPSGAPLRRVRAALEHLRRIHVAAVGGIQCHVA